MTQYLDFLEDLEALEILDFLETLYILEPLSSSSHAWRGEHKRVYDPLTSNV